MEYRTTEQLKRVAELYADRPTARPMTRIERLEHWAALLMKQPRRSLDTLHETEYQPPEARAKMRCDNSAISVAFADPVLREQGMTGDSYGDAKLFFELSDRELHGILCYCHWGATMTAESAADRIGAVARGGIFTRAWQTIAG